MHQLRGTRCSRTKRASKTNSQDNEVLIKVHAASINSWDWDLLQGKPFIVRLVSGGLVKPKKKILGCDVAGRIEAVGKKVKNSTFSDSAVENVSLEPSRKVVLNLGLTYDTTPEQMQVAMTILKDLAAANAALEENVSIGFNAFGDSAMNIIFVYYIKKEGDILGTQTEINMKVLEEFTKAGLDFAFPTQTLYTKQLA